MSEKSDHVVFSILSYLTRNPRAQDTLTGIVEWWLADLDPSARSWSDVEEAVRRLHREGFLSAARAADGRIRFGLAPSRRAAALRRSRELDELGAGEDRDELEPDENERQGSA